MPLFEFLSNSLFTIKLCFQQITDETCCVYEIGVGYNSILMKKMKSEKANKK